MNKYVNKNSLLIFSISIGCIFLLWLLGFGFGNETRISEILGITFLGSDVYLGTWFIFMMIIPIGFVIPFLTVRFIFHEKIQDYGFSLGHLRSGVPWLFVLIPAYIFIPLMSAYIGTEKYYTYLINPQFLKPLHIAIHCVSYIGFVLGFEFLFRGFVLFGLNRSMGNTVTSKWIAIICSSILGALCLIGLPWIFPVSALLCGIPGGLLNFRLRSFLYFAFIHWNIGVWSDIWEVVKLNIAHSIW